MGEQSSGSVPVPGPPPGPVTLVEGASFCRSRSGGDVLPGRADGLYVRDTRLLSRLEIRVDGREIEPLAKVLDPPAAATFVARVGRLLLTRRRWLGHGLRDDLELRNLAPEAVYVEMEVLVDGDLVSADAARTGAVPPPAGEIEVLADGSSLVLRRGRGSQRIGCRVSAPGAAVEPGRLRFEAIIPARGSWRTSLVVSPILDGEELEPRWRADEPVDRHASVEALGKWQRAVPDVTTDHGGLASALVAGAADLGALRVMDPEHPERAVVAAGAPWHLALHGRDALLSAWMALIVDPDLALGVVETLARFQGNDEDPRTEEQPGRILQRLRFGPGAFAARAVSYGSVDATPLFVMLLGELRRWGLAPQIVDRLLPHADRALEWIEQWGDRDGDGYVEYERATDRGPRHQAWRDSEGAIVGLDGREATTPIATAEVQAYVYGAHVARAHFATEAGDAATAAHHRARAAALKEAFNRDYWLDEHGWLAGALDGDKRPVDSPTSAMGHCLWAGILDEERAAVVAKQLLSPELFTGWGLRTLGASARSFDPFGWHTGAVWPHDTALAAAGLMRYGHVDEAHRLAVALLDAATASGGRVPPLLCGFDRDDIAVPVRIPDGSTARAWSAAAPFLVLRSLLRLDPWIPYGKLWLAPALPDGIGRLRVERIPLLGGRVSVDIDGDRVEVSDLPPGVELIAEPRRPLTAAVPTTPVDTSD